MNKADLIEALATRLGSRAQAALAVESVVDLVLREVASGGSVTITGFGTFERIQRAPRTGRNPRTGEPVPIAGTTSPRFRPGAYFKEVVGDPKQLPSEGLAGVRVGSHEGGGSAAGAGAGAPTSVRRSSSSRRTTSGAESEAGTRRGRRATASGTPTTVKKTELKAEQRPGRTADESSGSTTGPERKPGKGKTSTKPADGGRVFAGGEEITERILTAKKAQLARVRDDEDVVVTKDKKKNKGKKSRKNKGKKSKK